MTSAREWPSALPLLGHPTGAGVLLAVALGGTWFVHPAAGVLVVVLGLASLVRPLDPLIAWTATTVAAGFVNNEGGHLTRELAVVTALAAHAVFCTAVASRAGQWHLPRTPLLAPIGLLGASAVLAAAHGVLSGHSPKLTGLELLPLLMFGGVLLVGGLRLTPADRGRVLLLIVLAGLGHVALGMHSYEVNRIRTGGVWFTPIPGMLAGLTLHLALRERRAGTRFGFTLLTGLFLLHQLISFSRGYWLGLLVALPWTVVRFAGRGPGSRERWRAVGRVTLQAALIALAVAAGVSAWFGWTDLFGLLGTRFGSTFGTGGTSESASNIVRIVEYLAAAEYIRQSPWIGHGLGLEMAVREPIWGFTSHQWFVHHAYLLTWIKQGLLGLGALLWLLWTGFRTTERDAVAHREEPASAWSAGAVSATLYLAVVNLTSFHMAQVNLPTLLALLWGVVVAHTATARARVVWRATASLAEGGRA